MLRGEPATANAPKPRILLIEDEAVVREHLARALSDEYSIETAANGKDALTAVLKAPPALVVTDIVMPELDGIELLKALRSTRRTQAIPVLLISGRALDEQRIEGFVEGADGYLAKPYTERELRARIHSILVSVRRREETMRELAEQQALVERAVLLESITDAFYALDRAFRFTYLNKRALSHFGRTHDELLGKVIWDVFPATRGTAFKREYERALNEQCSVSFEAASLISGRWVDVRAYPTPEGLAAYFRDVTDRKRAEEQLREADRRKTEFLAVLAHELRNPMAPLRNGLHILKQSVADTALSRTVSMMDRQMSHLVRLVDDLLDVSRIARGRFELRRQKVLLSDVVASAVEACRALIEAQGHALEIDTRDRAMVIDADPDRLAQVFSNLLSNSAKYTDRGGRITLTLERDGTEAVAVVEDTGIGIPPEALGHVFEMFAQAERCQARTVEGLGIGLSLVKSLIEMHSGSVHAFSEGAGKGSRFTVRLPLADASPAHPSRSPGPTLRARPMRVLVVDDNVDAAASLAQLLQLEGHEVRTAADGVHAIAQVRAFEPEVIFMDLGMPRVDGFEATRRIRQLPGGERARIIALSGWGQETDRERTRAAGMDRHLIKPVSLEALHEVFEALGRD